MQNAEVSTEKIGVFRSIQGQLIIWFLLLSLVPLAVVGIVSYISGQDALQKSTQDELSAVAEAKASEVDNWLTITTDIVESLATSPSVAGDNDPSTYNGIGDVQRLRGSVDTRDAYEEAYSGALDTIEHYPSVFRRIDGVALANTDGRILVSSSSTAGQNALPEGKDVSNEDYFLQGLQGTYYGKTMESPEHPEALQFYLSMPIVDQQGQS